MSKFKTTGQSDYNEFLIRYLRTKNFASGGELNRLLIEKFKISDAYARKVLTRAVSESKIKSSKPYTFGRGQYIYLPLGGIFNVSIIKDISKISRPPLYRLLEMMDYNGGIISIYEAMKITASPIGKLSTKVSHLSEILGELIALDLIYKHDDNNGVKYILYKELEDGLSLEELIKKRERLTTGHFSKLSVDSSLIYDIVNWVRKSNIIDNKNILYRNKRTPGIGIVHNNLCWDALGYTKATGINKILGAKADSVEKQTLVVLDIVLSMPYTQEHLDGFYNRIQIVLNSVQTKERKVLPLVFYQECSPEVLNKLSKLGFIAFDIGSVFGSKIQGILSKFKEINDGISADESINNQVQEILNTMRNSGQEDSLKELKGVLFECLMYPVLKNLFPEAAFERGKKLTEKSDDNTKEGYEYDYIINSSNPPELIIVELKGYTSAATIGLGDTKTKSTLKWFFQKSFPFAAKHYKDKLSSNQTVKALFITSANFWEDGKKFVAILNTGKMKSSILNISYERADLISLLKSKSFKKEVEIIEKFYKKIDP